MKPPRILIMGGCLNTGNSAIPMNAIYHRIVARRMADAFGLKPRFHLGNQDSLGPGRIVSETNRCLDERPYDALIFQIRPELLWGLASLVWLNRGKGRVSGLRINPYLCNKLDWNAPIDGTRPTGKFQQINRWAGRLLGLDRFARRTVTRMLDDVESSCVRRNIPTFHIGPVFGPWYSGSFEQTVLDSWLPSEMATSGFVSARNLPADGWFADGLHLNERGHAVMADRTLEVLSTWVKSCSQASAAPVRDQVNA